MAKKRYNSKIEGNKKNGKINYCFKLIKKKKKQKDFCKNLASHPMTKMQARWFRNK